MKSQNNPTMPERRKLIVAGAGLAAASLIPHVSAAGISAQADSSGQASQRPAAPGKRQLGKLEVSAVGLGVQNMSRKYDTSVPWRPEMVNVIRRAFDAGVTFFDAAEAYGPFEVEKILGEGVAPFRDKIVIATKFGWNIDQQTGKRLPGLNSRPEHIRVVVENMLKRLRTDRIDLLYQHRVDPQIPIEDVAGVIKDLMVEGKVLHWGCRKWASTRCSARTQHYRSPPYKVSIPCSGEALKSMCCQHAKRWELDLCHGAH